MSNVLTGNPWVIDTAAVITTGPVTVLGGEWQEPTAADDLTILDNSGNTIYDDNALCCRPHPALHRKYCCGR